MADKTSTRKDLGPALGGKLVILDTGTVASLTGGSDTLTMTLADHGIKNVLAVQTYVHTTDLSVIALESATTSVVGGVLTVTTAAGNNDKRRVVMVYGE